MGPGGTTGGAHPGQGLPHPHRLPYGNSGPVKMEKGLVTEFLLMRNTMACCFGTVPNMNEWVIVKMKQGVQPMMDVPVSFYGSLKVGAMFENGYMTGLYELEGERMGEVKG